MAGGSWQDGKSRKKRVRVADLDELLYLHAQSFFGDTPPAEDDEPPDSSIDLGYPLAKAFDLWTAWKDHNVMPRRGGYLDQPRRWRTMIHAMNRRYALAYDRAKAEHRPDDARDDDGDVLQDIIGQQPAFEYGDQRPSWERFGQ